MSANKFMNVSELAEELGENKITVEFWLKRFNKWLPHIIEKDQKLYSMEILTRLIFIAERINAGILPSKTENALKEKFFSSSDSNAHEKDTQNKIIESIEKELLKGDSVNLLHSFIANISANQERIAKAHERRAEAEERKAIAIEKRAEAEEKKALAMNNIANALQNMKHEVWPVNTENQIKGETARAISLLVENDADGKDNYDSTDTKSHDNFDIIDDLSLLIDNDETTETPVTNTMDKETAKSMDDLSLLINDEKAKEISAGDTVDKKTNLTDVKTINSIDDLSLLIDADAMDGSKTSKSSDKSGTLEKTGRDDLDDLSLLIDEKIDEKKDQDLDDLSLLIDDETEQTTPAQSDLVPSVTLEENFNQYKSEIINSIIKLKKQGLSIKETTQRLNRAGIKTLSGKNRWGIKTIAKIYKFIESVA